MKTVEVGIENANSSYSIEMSCANELVIVKQGSYDSFKIVKFDDMIARNAI
jgi:hypothetical protein